MYKYVELNLILLMILKYRKALVIRRLLIWEFAYSRSLNLYLKFKWNWTQHCTKSDIFIREVVLHYSLFRNSLFIPPFHFKGLRVPTNLRFFLKCWWNWLLLPLRVRRGVNFTNILLAPFSYAENFFVLTFNVRPFLAYEYWRKYTHKLLVKSTRGHTPTTLSNNV